MSLQGSFKWGKKSRCQRRRDDDGNKVRAMQREDLSCPRWL